MTWSWQFTSRARRDFRRLSDSEQTTILRILNQATKDPSSVDFRKLSGSIDTWRIRVGRWRIIVELNNDEGLMSVTRILPRDQAYR